MTDEESLAATEAFARRVARRGLEEIRQACAGLEVAKASNPVGYFAAVHSGVAAAYMLGWDLGRASALCGDGKDG